MNQKTNNPNGRPIGVPNKVTANLKDRVNLLIENNFDKFQLDLDSVEPKDRLNLLLKLIEYVLPKQKETKIDFSNLSDAEIDELINRITKSDEE
jgi:hypothetical protein